jgi:hypothetical protein
VLLKSYNFANLGGAISKALAKSLPITFRSVNSGFLLGEYGIVHYSKLSAGNDVMGHQPPRRSKAVVSDLAPIAAAGLHGWRGRYGPTTASRTAANSSEKTVLSALTSAG